MKASESERDDVIEGKKRERWRWGRGEQRGQVLYLLRGFSGRVLRPESDTGIQLYTYRHREICLIC